MIKIISSSSKQSLSLGQIFCLMPLTLIGPIQLRFPQIMADNFGINSTYVILLYGLILWIPAFVMSRLALRFPGKSFVQYVALTFETARWPLVGKICTWGCYLLLACDLLLIAGVLLRTFIEPITDLFLFNTPPSLLIALTILILVVCANYRLNVVVWLNQLFFPLSILFVCFVVTVMFFYGQFANLLPFDRDIVSPWPKMQLAFLGLEALLIYGSYYKKGAAIFLTNSLVILFAVLFNTLSFISSLSVFGVDQLRWVTYPTLDMFEEVNFLTSLILFIYFFICFASVVNLLTAFKVMIFEQIKVEGTATNKLQVWLCKKKFQQWLLFLCIPVIYLIVRFPVDWIAIDQYYLISGWLSIIVVFLLPIILLLVALLRKRGV